uniref:Cullin family profile domain-containing protein n=1 Tax=Ditylenchus dipsaci TaxID=166011 RepID=A0A915D362_9BILA
MSTRKCAERAAIDLVVAKAFDLLVLHSSAKTNLKLKRLIDENGGYGIQQLARELDREIQRRVMDSEVLTHSLLEVYLALTQASRLFKEIGAVCARLSAFIKTRSDLVNTLVGLLSQEEHHIISNSNSEHLKAFSDEYISIEDDNDEDTWFKWMPLPRLENIDHEPKFGSNLTSTLFSIFGSKEKFLEQYQKELASRLVSKGWSKLMQFEVLGILKKMFSDREMEGCEVMLWDIRNSEKLLTRSDKGHDIISRLPFVIHPKILSSEYWPDSFISCSNSGSSFHAIHHSVFPALKQIEKYFTRISLSKRHLNWSPFENSGNTLEIELEICDPRSIKTLPAMLYEVSLIDAVIISLFLEKEKWTFEELKLSTGLETLLIRQAIHRWFSKGLLKCHNFEEKILVVELVCLPTMNLYLTR